MLFYITDGYLYISNVVTWWGYVQHCWFNVGLETGEFVVSMYVCDTEPSALICMLDIRVTFFHDLLGSARRGFHCYEAPTSGIRMEKWNLLHEEKIYQENHVAVVREEVIWNWDEMELRDVLWADAN